MCPNKPLSDSITDAVKAVAGCPAIHLSLGNVALASQTAEPVGFALTALTSAAVTGGKIYESVTGKPLGLPYYVLAAVNGATAASVLTEGYNTLGIDGLSSLSQGTIECFAASTAFTGWGVGHLLAGLHEKRATNPKNALGNPQTYYGVGDLAAVQGNPVASAIFALGLAKALVTKPKEEDSEVKSLSGFFKKHITPARMYGAGYAIGSLMSLNNPTMAIAQLAWGIGYMNFEPSLNGSLFKDLRLALKRSGQKNLDPFDSEINAIMGSLPDVAATIKAGNWDQTAETMLTLYKQTPKDCDEKIAVFTMLEVLACYAEPAATGLTEMAYQNDPLSLEKRRRMADRLIHGTEPAHPRQELIDKAKRVVSTLNGGTPELWWKKGATIPALQGRCQFA